MKSFQTELENPIVQQDIIDLEKKIRLFKEGKIDSEKFRSLRLARGVYGQRQEGVQMIRIKLPFGKVTPDQLIKICDVADEYSSGVLHATTRQDIQIHFVKLEQTPELWAKLEQSDITLREACGNTVRNITASDIAGIDPDEPFDVSPYADGMFRYFLRNPVCQEMGRKFKIAFSSSDKDTALTFMHDLGFIPKLNEQGERGFKVLIGGGLGAQSFLAPTAYEFLHEDLIIPFTEGVLRVFDKYGERTRRHKARIKYLLNDIGLEKLMELVAQEQKALKSKIFKIDRNALPVPIPKAEQQFVEVKVADENQYQTWLATNVFEQKQKGFYGVYIKVLLGNLKTSKARELAEVAREFAADDIRITINQNYLFKFVRKEALPHLFNALHKIGLSEAGFNSTADITACPGTDTCNLGISSSTGTAVALEQVVKEEFPEFLHNKDVDIKISGCMNSCGQHMAASIGFQGSSLKSGAFVLPSLQLVLGGGAAGNGVGLIAEKVIKVPSKRGPQLVRNLLNDYKANVQQNEKFNDYFRRQGKNYFYELLKPLADLSNLTQEDFIDWGHTESYKTAVGVGECAGVMIDLVATLIYEAEEKYEWATKALENKQYADAIYHSYATLISGAKAMLLGKQVQCNTHNKIISDFQENFVATGEYSAVADFTEFVNQIQKNEPTKEFAEKYFAEAGKFLKDINDLRNKQIAETPAAN
ncbi:MAG: HEPN domain-containing protein [Bacteroidia bacterium]